jgi:hypothetical protein
MNILISVICLFFSTDVFAYFDPGTGSILIQGLIGGIAAISLFFGRIKLWLSVKFGPKENNVDEKIVTEKSEEE